MQIHAAQRRVSLSVGELAAFRTGPAADDVFAGRWRMGLGSAWHTSLHAEAGDSNPCLRTEVPLDVVLLHGGWRFELSGRIDQLEDNAAAGFPPALAQGADTPPLTQVRELKTTSLQLPLAEAEARARYPHYFRQLAIYAYGWSVRHQQIGCPLPPVCGQLQFVNIHDGERQTLDLTPEQAEAEALAALERLLPFLEARARTRLSLHGAAQAVPAFESYRDGQQEALEQLRSALVQAQVSVFEAPTGFGKTGIALECALEQMRKGVFARVIYLSGKTTGQHQVMRQLRQMNAQAQWRFFQLRSRREHTEQPPGIRMDGRRRAAAANRHSGIADGGQAGAAHRHQADNFAEPQWRDFGIFPEQLLDAQQADVDSLRQLGARTGLCPYQLAKACLPYADIWIGDYNYVFSERHRRVFFDQPGFDPRQTLLIADEAHNLPSRVADNLSLSLSAATAEAVALELRLADAPFLLTQAWEAWAAFLQGVKPAETLPQTMATEAAAHLNLLCERADLADTDALPPFVREAVAEAFWQARQCALSERLPYLLWAPRHGQLNFTCLDAAEAIGATLRDFGATLLMSATPGPHNVFAESLGLEEAQVRFVPGRAAWREGACEVAIDTTVDTRLRYRPQFYRQTADTIGRFALGANGPLTVFFPSYQYAEVVLKYLEALHPALIVKVQPRAVDPGGQLTFIEESLLLAHVLFFVLGSSFSESIDHLGGRVDRAMIVGPALPEVNPVQEARLARLQGLGREEAFRRVYQIPALQKINQALGRLVRAPGQSARVLLHDRRFAQNSYQRLLAPEYQQAQVLTDEAALHEWICR